MIEKERLYKARYQKFNNGNIRFRDYKNLLLKPKSKISENSSSSEKKKRKFGKIEKRSLSKTRRLLIDLIENNEDKFNTFITLTFKEEIEDIDVAYNYLKNYLLGCKRYCKSKVKPFYYLAVPEIQKQRAKKTGKYVIHFHLITNIEVGSARIPERPEKEIDGPNHKGRVKIKYYDLIGWDSGLSLAIPIVRTEQFRLSLYLTKYLYKDLDDRFYGRQKVLHSNNLKVPEMIYLINEEEIMNFKKQNEDNISEVFACSGYQNQYAFTEYNYKKEKEEK